MNLPTIGEHVSVDSKHVLDQNICMYIPIDYSIYVYIYM